MLLRRVSRTAAAAASALLLVLLSAPTTTAAAAAATAEEPGQHQRQPQHEQRGLDALSDLPITYSQYLPGWVTSDDYRLGYWQSPSLPSWVDPAQQGVNRPGWMK
jgi:hypothetical protein